MSLVPVPVSPGRSGIGILGILGEQSRRLRRDRFSRLCSGGRGVRAEAIGFISNDERTPLGLIMWRRSRNDHRRTRCRLRAGSWGLGELLE